jgi:ABC-type bacteriocin/lantibiotic exporter with double-glycine peptidase domain
MTGILKKIYNDIIDVLTEREKKRFYQFILLNSLVNIADILFLALLVLAVNFYVHPGDATLSFLPAFLTAHHSPALIGYFLVLFSLKNLAAHFLMRAQYLFAYRVATRISKEQLLQYFKTDYIDHVHTDSAIYIRKIGQQPAEFCQYVLTGLQQVISQSILALLAIAGILLYQPQLFLVLLIVLLPPVFLAARKMKKQLKIVRAQTRSSSEKSLQHLKEALNGYTESNIFNAETFFTSRYGSFQHALNGHLATLQIVQSLPNRLIEIFAILGLFTLILVHEITGSSSANLIVIGTFMAAAYKIIPGIVKVINLGGQISAYKFSIEGLSLMRTEKNDNKNPGHLQIDSIQLRDVRFQYDHNLVLNNFSFCIERGDFSIITGQSGVGKTTILHLLLGFLTPHGGKVLINKKTVGKEEIMHYRSRISYVKQQPFLIHDTLLQNITLQTGSYNIERLQHAMEISGLDKIIESWPERMNKMITENGKNISGGQRQRIAIARALYKDFDMIILDEPFSELDEESQSLLLIKLKKLAATGKMIVLVTHDKSSLSFANKITRLDGKK